MLLARLREYTAPRAGDASARATLPGSRRGEPGLPSTCFASTFRKTPLTGQLVNLGLHHAEALEHFLSEFDSRPEELHAYFCDRHASIKDAVEQLRNWSEGVGLNDGWVPCSTLFWEEDHVLKGVINIRHHLSPGLEAHGGHIGYAVSPSHRKQGIATAMLSAGLGVCQQLDITRALVTCDCDNRGSWRTIERNGGILERESWNPELQRMTRRYWIDLTDDRHSSIR